MGYGSMQTTYAAAVATPTSVPNSALPGLAKAGWRDLADGATKWRLSYLMGSSDIRRRYARSRLGQLWIMLSSTIMVATTGLIWSYLWKQPVREILPFVAIGMITWQLLSSMITDAATALPANSRYFHNQYISASTIIYSLLYRNGVTFAFNLLFPLLITIALGARPGVYSLLSLLGLALVAVASVWVAYVVAILCTRFRDIVQIISSVLQIAFFVTPVVWKPEILSANAQWYLLFNPFAVFISIVRDPILGRPVLAASWIEAFALSFGGLALALAFIGKFRRRLVYWL